MDTPDLPTIDPAQPDLGWLGLARAGSDDDRWSFELTSGLSRLDGKFFGGTGLAVATALIEARTSRPALWAAAQFVGTCAVGDRLDCHVEVLAHGRRSSQLRITGSVGDQMVFTGLGTAGLARGTAVEAQFPELPDVGGPDDARSFDFQAPPGVHFDRDAGWLEHMELRSVPKLGPRSAMWARMRHGLGHSRASLGFVADIVPVGVLRAAGRAGAGTSLDNAIRLGPAPQTEWVLLEVDPYLASAGYLHGAARIWSEDGVLVAVASQTATVMLFD